MRLGGPAGGACQDPAEWAAAHRRAGYSAAFWPLGPGRAADEVDACVKAARQDDLLIAEVGAWSNPISPSDEVRRMALEHCQERLAAADRVGAACCVNIAGSRCHQDPGRLTAPGWDAPDPENLTDETFDLIVETVRAIIDAVKPTRSYYTLETMPWVYPDSPDSYLRLIRAIDRRQFAVHLDPVNLVQSPQRYFQTGALIRECCEKLGPYIRSCHAKDILLERRLTVHLSEVRPGTGGLDYRAFLREVGKMDPDLPVMLEHLKGEEDYRLAAEYVRSVAEEVGVQIR